MSAAFMGFTGRVGSIAEARDELDAVKFLVALFGAVASSDQPREIWDGGAAHLAHIIEHQIELVGDVLANPEEGRRT